MAVPSAVAHSTVTVLPLAAARVTGKRSVPAFSRADASAAVTAGASSLSVIVPVAIAVPSSAPSGLESVTVNVSSASSMVSSASAMAIVLDVSFAPKVSVPEPVVKSVPALAVSVDSTEVRQSTVVWLEIAGAMVTVKLIVPASSCADAGAMENDGSLSLSWMDPSARARLIWAVGGEGRLSSTSNSPGTSLTASSIVVMLMSLNVSPAAKVSVPSVTAV